MAKDAVLIADGEEFSLGGSSSGGVNFTPGDTMELSEDNILNVKLPNRGVITEEEYEQLTEEEKLLNVYVVSDGDEEENDEEYTVAEQKLMQRAVGESLKANWTLMNTPLSQVWSFISQYRDNNTIIASEESSLAVYTDGSLNAYTVSLEESGPWSDIDNGRGYTLFLRNDGKILEIGAPGTNMYRAWFTDLPEGSWSKIRYSNNAFNSIYVATKANSNEIAYIKYSGSTWGSWTVSEAPLEGNGDAKLDLVNGYFFYFYPGETSFAVSVNATDWTVYELPSNDYVSIGYDYAMENYVAIGQHSKIAYSKDLIAWDEFIIDKFRDEMWNIPVYFRNRYISPCMTKPGLVAYSKDGKIWGIAEHPEIDTPINGFGKFYSSVFQNDGIILGISKNVSNKIYAALI